MAVEIGHTYCVDANGTPLAGAVQCAQLLASQGAQVLGLALCMHRVLILAAMGSPKQRRRARGERALFYALALLTTAATLVCVALAVVAFPLHSTGATVISGSVSAAFWWFHVSALCLCVARRAPRSGRLVGLATLEALINLLQLHQWIQPLDAAAPLRLVFVLMHARALLACVVASLAIIALAATVPPRYGAECDVRGEDGSPFDRASLLSRVSYRWISPLIELGKRRRLEMDDVPQLPHKDSTNRAATAFARALETELCANNPSFLRLLRRLYGREVGMFAAWSTLNKAIGLASPLLIKLFLDWADESTPQLATGYTLALLMVVRSLASSVSGTQYTLAWKRFDIRVRAGIIAAIYNRTLHLSARAKRRYGIGRITNLVSVDLGRLVGMPGTVFDMFLIPGEIVFALVLLAHEVKYAFIGGVVVLGCMLPIQTVLGGKIQSVTTAMLEYRDKRVDSTAESLKAMRTIKLLAWTDLFFEKIDAYRRLEMGRLSVRKYLDALCVFFWASTPVIVQTTVFVTVIYTGHDLTAANAFTAVSLLDRLIYPMNYFPWIINGFLEARVSALRIRDFLFPSGSADRFIAPMILPPLKTKDKTMHDVSKRNTVEMYDCKFAWDVQDDGVDDSNASAPLMSRTYATFELRVSQLHLKSGTSYVVCGPVGSGKSSLLLALLGEMPRTTGSLRLLRACVSYAPQSPWLFRGTVRQNIAMCDDTSPEFDETLYRRVLVACELEADLQTRNEYDMTVVNECGTNFSGGQRVRINLARALYQRTKLYLLDDPLSGLDAETARRVMANCFGPTPEESVFAAGATIVIATHAIHVIEAFPNSVQVIIMVDGHVTLEGSYEHIKAASQPSQFMEMLARSGSQYVRPTDETACGQPGAITADDGASVNSSKQAHDFVECDEHRESGTVHLRVWQRYASAIGWHLSVAIFVCVTVMQVSRNGLDCWIAFYTNSHSISPTSFADMLLWITLVNCASVLFRSFLFAFGGLQAARATYATLITKIFGASLRFFGATPVGRMLNRLSGDTYSVDESLPFILNIFLKDFADVVGSLVVIFYGNSFVLLLLVPLAVVYFRIQDAYRPTSRHVQRLESTTQSPILSMFTETLDGLSVIRAMKLQQKYELVYENCLNLSQRMSFLGANAGSWFGIRLDMLGVCVTSFVVVFAVLQFQVTQHVSPGVLGLTLTYALPIVSKLNTILGSFVATERQMIAVERVYEYADLPGEEETIPIGRTCLIPPSWPAAGGIIVKNLSVQYDALGEDRLGRHVTALNRVSCEVSPGEKIGICGRTGAGKSTFMHTLFRAVPWVAGGSIFIDGVNIQQVPMQLLRSRLTYIPQDVVLFAGSVRSNLDPSAQAQDHELWSSLSRCGLDATVSGLTRGLDSVVESGEGTFSKGQAQLLCIARALLRRSKILCIDEATSSVDYSTESIVTKMLDDEFAEATVIVIAHRLKAIMDCDRILLFDNGEIVESGPPRELMGDHSTRFSQLALNAERTVGNSPLVS